MLYHVLGRGRLEYVSTSDLIPKLGDPRLKVRLGLLGGVILAVLLQVTPSPAPS